MSTQRFLGLLVAALLAIGGAMYLSSQRHLDRDTRGALLLPGLNAQLDHITDIRLRKASAKPIASLQRRQPGAWVVLERDNYPADLGKIRRLLISLGEAKIIEEKTSNPASYAVLGVEDAGLASAGGIEVALLGASKPVTLIVGHPAGNGSYVRRGGDAQTYAVEPAIALEGDAKDWIDTRLLDLPFEKIQSIRMQLSDGSHYVISRLPPPPAAAGKDKAATPPEGFRLAAVPAGREANEPGLIAPSPTSFDGVPAEDVAPVAGIDFSKPSIAEISLTGGATLTITGTAAADKHWIQLKSSDDAALNAKTQGRAFEVASYRYEAIFRPLEQLLKPKPVKAASGHLPGTPAHSPAANRKLPNGTP